MTRRPTTIAAHVTLECPRCGQRITTALPIRGAGCHDRHPWADMRPVDDATTDASDR